jgi:hypothetical protein
MNYGEMLKFQDLIEKLDNADFNDLPAEKAVDAIMLVDSYRNSLKPFDDAKQKWYESNKDFSEKWNKFVQEISEKLNNGENVPVPEELREGRLKMNSYFEDLANKEVENFSSRKIFDDVDQWKTLFGNLVPKEYRLGRELGIIE